MGKAKNNAGRTLEIYLWIIGTVYEAGREGLTLNELNMPWLANDKLSEDKPMTRGTLGVRREAIKNIFGINIECRKSDDKYYIEFTPGRGVGAIRREAYAAIAVNRIVSKSSDLWTRIQYDKFEHGKLNIIPLLSAIKEEMAVEIIYMDEYTNEVKTPTVSPLYLIERRQRWYLLGYEYEEKDYPVSIALDCIIEILKSEAEPIECTDSIDDFIAEQFPLFDQIADSNKRNEGDVKLKVYGGLSEYLKNFPLHHTQIEFEKNNGFSIFMYDLIPNSYFIEEILRYGSRIEVVEPQSLRKEVGSRIRKMMKLYQETE